MFLKDMTVQHHEVEPLQRELRSTKVKGSSQVDNLPIGKEALISLLPQKGLSDQLVQIYVDSLESTYRVLHLPSFWEEYSHFWKAPQEGKAAFAAIILLILASTYCIKEAKASMFRGDSSVGRETAILWVRTCDLWLQTQSQKHTTIATFQVHCLSFIAKKINSIKRKQIWASAGSLVRLALSSGLHRDAQIINLRHSSSSTRKVSVFDQEMRRRMWATISDLELQTAFERGMPAMLRDFVEDCGPPLNLDDEEFLPSTDQLGRPGPISNYTRSSFQHLSRSSWSLRLELVSVINGPHPQMTYEVVLMYDKKITQHLDEIPHWIDKASLVPRVLLQLQLQMFMLFLHRPYAREQTRNSRYEYSAVVHLTSAMRILDLHQQLMDVGNSFLCLFRNDVFGAALNICFNYSTSEPSPGKLQFQINLYSLSLLNPDQDLLSRNSIKQLSSDLLPYLEKALNMIGDKILCIGIGLQEYYCVCAIIGLLKKTQSPDHSSDEEQKAGYRVGQIVQKLLSLQDNYSAAATLASLPKMVSTSRDKTVPLSNVQPVPAPTSACQSNGHSNGGNNINGTGNANEIGLNGPPMDGIEMLEVNELFTWFTYFMAYLMLTMAGPYLGFRSRSRKLGFHKVCRVGFGGFLEVLSPAVCDLLPSCLTFAMES